MPEDLKLSQIGSSQLPPPFRGLHSRWVRKHCQIIFACYFRKSSVEEPLPYVLLDPYVGSCLDQSTVSELRSCVKVEVAGPGSCVYVDVYACAYIIRLCVCIYYTFMRVHAHLYIRTCLYPPVYTHLYITCISPPVYTHPYIRSTKLFWIINVRPCHVRIHHKVHNSLRIQAIPVFHIEVYKSSG